MKTIRLFCAILFVSAIAFTTSVTLQTTGLQARSQAIASSVPAEYPLCMPQGYRALMQGPSAICYDPISDDNYLAIRCELDEGWCTYIDCQPPCYIIYE